MSDLKERLKKLCELEEISDKKVINWLSSATFEAHGLRAHPLEIGRILSEGKKLLKHGQYGHWVEEVLRLERMCAGNYRRAWECFSGDKSLWDNIQLTAMYILAGKSEWHAKAKEECLKLARDGETVSRKTAQQMIDKYKPKEPEAERPAFIKQVVPEELDRVSVDELTKHLDSICLMLEAGYQLLENIEIQGYSPKDTANKLEKTASKLADFAEFVRNAKPVEAH